jgi:hypothetical protein
MGLFLSQYFRPCTMYLVHRMSTTNPESKNPDFFLTKMSFFILSIFNNELMTSNNEFRSELFLMKMSV